MTEARNVGTHLSGSKSYALINCAVQPSCAHFWGGFPGCSWTRTVSLPSGICGFGPV